MINRSAISIAFKQPFVDWINEADPIESPNETLEALNRDTNIYLIDEAEDADEAVRWVQENYMAIFQEELEAWYIDADLWPADLSYEHFCEFFEISFHGIVFDLGTGDLEEDIDY